MRKPKTWMMALGGLGAAWLPAIPSLAEEPTPKKDLEPDRAALKRFLRGSASLKAPLEVPPEVSQALGRLSERDPQRAHVWKAIAQFLAQTAAEEKHKSEERIMTRMAIAPGKMESLRWKEWRSRAKALLALVWENRLSEDVYREARKALEDSLRQALSEKPKEGEAPFPRTVDEAAGIVLSLLEPELTEPAALSEALRKELAACIEQLGDPDFKKREAAAENLRKAGEPALGLLRQAFMHHDPEVADRAKALWKGILEKAYGGKPQ